MDYSFNVQLAEKYGVEEAVLLNHLYFWIQHNSANKQHFHDGRYWTYNSAQAFTEIFPFWSRQKIDRIVQKLREEGAIIVDNFNDDKRDRTRWFTLSDSTLSVIDPQRAIAAERPAHCSEKEQTLPKTEQPLPDSKPDINTDNKLTLAHFDEFWDAYPKKKSKDAARRAFEKLVKSRSAPTITRLIDSVKAHEQTPDWKKDGGQFIPYPATYLNAGAYDDVLQPPPKLPSAPNRQGQFDEYGRLIT